MKAVYISILAGIVSLILSPSLLAQNNLSGSFETNSIYYLNDKKSGAVAPENNLSSNNYLKLDYQYKKFTAGVQFESYLPVLQGLPSPLKGSNIAIKYASFQDSNFSITAGDFYEQLGNGLILRAYEERSLGLNTALEGARASYIFKNYFILKGLLGRPREFMKKTESIVKAASLAIDIGTLLQSKQSLIKAELSIVNRYESYTGQELIDPNVNAYSVKANWLRGGFSVQGEYAYKSTDPSAYTHNKIKDGSALLVEIGYNQPGFGSLLTVRRLEYMQFGTTRGVTGVGRDLNYLPALTKQHTYSLAALNPHNTLGNDEIGGQIELQYKFRRHSILGGRFGTKLAFNASAYYSLQGNPESGYNFLQIGDKKYYQDINIEVEKKINPQLITHFLFSQQVFNPIVIGKENDHYGSKITAGDLIWKATPLQSFKLELQHLWSRNYYKNWAATTIEFAASPSWTCFIGDMYNYGDTNIHYYKAGGSFTASRSRVTLQYGRNRAGIICTGGICLYMPAYTGLNLTLTSSF